jgi:acetyl-CoA C-acetyltransferase/acetyl-CoA acyltransferase
MKAKSPIGKMKTLSRIRPADLKPVFGIEQGLRDPVSGLIMGETAEKLAREFGISRQEQDEFALRSHHKAAEGWQSGRLKVETMPVYPEPKLEPIKEDVGFRASQTLEALAKLKPFFDRKYGTVTVGNSSQVTDGAVALVLMDEELAKAKGYPIMGRIKGFAYAGCDPARMGIGPVYAVKKVLKQTGMKLSDVDLTEINEAFAAQVLACLRAMESDKFCKEQFNNGGAIGEIPMEKLNINGGAIALGHPVGATGARLVLTLLEELERRGQSVGLATLCVGGGQGGACIVERN